MPTLPLSQNQVAKIDAMDYPRLSEFRWCYRAERNNKQGYAVRHVKVNGKDRLSYLHREIMPAPPGMEVIFLNHDRLDCRRENLRVVTKQEARQHHRVRSDSKSGLKGVRYDAESDVWIATLYRDGRSRHLGSFTFEAAAVKAYQAALRRENPDLHMAPAKIERSDPGIDGQQSEEVRVDVQRCA